MYIKIKQTTSTSRASQGERAINRFLSHYVVEKIKLGRWISLIFDEIEINELITRCSSESMKAV